MIRVLLGGVDISNTVSLGSSFREKITYDLDEAQILIAHSTRNTPYTMWKTVDFRDIETNDFIYSGAISGDRVTLVSKKPLLYKHEINVVEHTKKLERYTISTKLFTQPLGSEGKYTLKDVFEILRDTVPVRTNEEVGVSIPFNIPNHVAALLDQYEAPELTLKEYTLREALDEALSFIDAKVRLDRNGDISVDFFNTKNNLVTGIRTTKTDLSQDINEYSTKLVSNTINPVPNTRFFEFNVEGNASYPAFGFWTTLRGRKFIFGPDDSVVPTPDNIYKVNQLLVRSRVRLLVNPPDPAGLTEVFFDELEYDISDRVVEKRAYETLRTSINPSLNIDTFFQQTVLSYVYGKKNVFVGETYGIFDTNDVLSNVLRMSIVKAVRGKTFSGFTFPANMNAPVFTQGGTQYTIELPELTSDTFLTYAKFRTHYSSVPDTMRVEIDREDTSDIKFYTELMTNQKSRIIDSESFMDNVKFTVDKKGLADLELSHIAHSFSDTFNIGDFTDDGFIVTEKEVICYKDHYRCLYKLNKNFNKTSLFTGLHAEERQWDIAEDGRTVERELMIKDFINVHSLDFLRPTAPNTRILNQSYMHDQLRKTFIRQEEPLPDSVTNLMIRTFKLPDEGPPQIVNDAEVVGGVLYNALSTGFTKHYGGNTFSWNMGFEDNVSAGSRARDEEHLGAQSGNPILVRPPIPKQFANEFVRYTDAQGRFDYTQILFFNDNPNRSVVSASTRYPLVTQEFSQEPVGQVNVWTKKDNREVLRYNFAYQFMANQRKVVIGKFLSNRNYIFAKVGISPVSETSNFNIRVYADYKFNKSANEFAPPSSIADQEMLASWVNGVLIVNNSIINNPAVSSWAIVDSEDRLVLAVNGNGGGYIHFDLDTVQTGMEGSIIFPIPDEIQIDLEASATMGVPAIDFSETGVYIIELESNNTINGILLSSESNSYLVSLVALNQFFTNVDFVEIADPLLDLTVSNTVTCEVEALPLPFITLTLEVVNGFVCSADVGIGSVEVDWVEGGTKEQADATPDVCEETGDVGNVRELTSTTREWVTISTFLSQTDQTTSGTCVVSGDVGNDRTVCAPDFESGQFLCFVQECTEIVTSAFETCEVK